MKITFLGDLSTELQHGIQYLSEDLGYTVCEDGLQVYVSETEKPMVKVEKKGAYVKLTYSKPCCFYRALGILMQYQDREVIEITEEPQFETLGAMYDVCQGNAVINVKNVKTF